MTSGDESEWLPVVAATITASHVRVEMATSVLVAMNVDKAVTRWMVQTSGPYLDMSRNRATRRFLNYPAELAEGEHYDEEFMLWVDSDEQFTGDDVKALVKTARAHHKKHGVWPVVGGAYLGIAGGQHVVVAYRWQEEKRDTDGVMIQNLVSIPRDEMKKKTPVEVDAIGTGFMLIHRSILEEMAGHFPEPQPWYYEGPMKMGDGSGVWFGEDLWFCFRAAALGHPILLHRGVKLVHYKDIGLAFS